MAWINFWKIHWSKTPFRWFCLGTKDRKSSLRIDRVFSFNCGQNQVPLPYSFVFLLQIFLMFFLFSSLCIKFFFSLKRFFLYLVLKSSKLFFLHLWWLSVCRMNEQRTTRDYLYHHGIYEILFLSVFLCLSFFLIWTKREKKRKVFSKHTIVR
jgi:hypothetical protein